MSVATTAENRIDRAGTAKRNKDINTVRGFHGRRATSKKRNVVLWIVQGLLAALFLFAGSTKLILPLDVLMSMGSPNQVALPGWFIRFIGVAEVVGAIGLILPQLLRIRPQLTPVAAMGLVIIMIGATSLTWVADGLAPASFPMVVALLASFVAYSRSRTV
jgi:DoxX-like family